MEMWIFDLISYCIIICIVHFLCIYLNTVHCSHVNQNIHSKAFDNSLHLLLFDIWHWNQIWMLFFYFICEFLLKYFLYLILDEFIDWNSFRFSKCDAKNGISVFIPNSNRYAFMNILSFRLLLSSHKNWMTTLCD